MKLLTIGSRRSQLAQIQSEIIRDQLRTIWADLEVNIELIDTKGDLNRKDPLPAIGGKGLFTLELEQALGNQSIDLAVHSLKDLPVEDSPGLTIIAIPKRAAANDLLISRQADSLDDLQPQAVVGTSSLRRAAQILAYRPDLRIKDIRGNVDTRLRKLDEPDLGYDAIILAQAGLDRMGHSQLDYAHPIPDQIILPAPGQGALAVQSRVDDPQTTSYLDVLDHPPTRAAVSAERAFLAGLGGGCSLPVGALASIDNDQLTLQGLVASPAGTKIISVQGSGAVAQAVQIGRQLAQQTLAQGAGALLHPQSA